MVGARGRVLLADSRPPRHPPSRVGPPAGGDGGGGLVGWASLAASAGRCLRLNAKPDVDPGTVKTVLAAVQELDYAPSSTAVSLARGRAHSIGLLAPALSRP